MALSSSRSAIYVILSSLLSSSISQSSSSSSTGPSSHPNLHPNPKPNSSNLTKQLLSLDLGIHVLNDQMLRENIGVGLHKSPDKSEERRDYFGDDEDFFGELNDDSFGEFLPSASALVSKDEYQHQPEPDAWNTNERFFFTLPGFRRRAPPPRDKFFVGDQAQCLTGTCEFFLFCWLGGGIVEGGCGGFMMSCCNRPNTVGHKTIVLQVGPNLASRHLDWGHQPTFKQSNVRKHKNNCGHSRGDQIISIFWWSWTFLAPINIYCLFILTGSK